MKKLFRLTVTLLVLFVVLTRSLAMAAEPDNQADCENNGGQWTGTSSTVGSCSGGERVTQKGCRKSFLGFPSWYKYLEVERNSGTGVCEVVGPSETVVDDRGTPEFTADDVTYDRLNTTSVVTRVGLAIIDILLRVAGAVAFAFIVVSGFKFVLSQGNPDQEKAARETAINAVIGMVIAMFAVVIVTYIGNRIVQ